MGARKYTVFFGNELPPTFDSHQDDDELIPHTLVVPSLLTAKNVWEVKFDEYVKREKERVRKLKEKDFK